MYIEKFWELYKVLNKNNFYKPKIYKTYFKYLKEALNKVKQLNKKEKIKYKLFYGFKYLFWILVYTYKVLKKAIAKLDGIIDNLVFSIRYKKYFKRIKKKNQYQYLIFNGPNHGNLGDHAILLAEEMLLRNKGILPFEILSHQAKYFIKKYKYRVKDKDIIMITGGGNLGTLWEHEQIGVNEVIKQFKDNKIVIFPQTIYYSKDRHGNYRMKVDNELYHQCKDLLISCRDKKTYDFCKEILNVNAIYTPDIVTFLDYSDNNNQRSGIMICFRDDKEKVIDNNTKKNINNILLNKFKDENIRYTSTVISGKFSYNKGKKEVLNLLNEISMSKLFITDRLHGMIFACITGTPCIALANSSGKVKGVYEWLCKENEYVKFVENADEIESALNTMDLSKRYKYKNEKMKKILNKII